MRKQHIAYLGIAAASLTFLYRQNSDSIPSLANGFTQHYLSGKQC